MLITEYQHIETMVVKYKIVLPIYNVVYVIRETDYQEILDVHLSFFDYFSYLLEKIMIVLEDKKLGQELEPGCDRTFFFCLCI